MLGSPLESYTVNGFERSSLAIKRFFSQECLTDIVSTIVNWDGSLVRSGHSEVRSRELFRSGHVDYLPKSLRSRKDDSD